MSAKELSVKALLTAMFFVLSMVSLNFGNMVISFAGFPVILAGLLYGPVGGMEVGLLGAFLEQAVKYGLTATTFLWIIPPSLRGLVVGLYASRVRCRITRRGLFLSMIAGALCVTAANTAVMAADSIIYGYFSWQYVFGSLIFRILSGMLTSVLYLILSWPVLTRLSPVLGGRVRLADSPDGTDRG
ncbi:MAG: ECF transporter S component [Lachnospiraceae bacterium]|jgi:ECF transporter S component (folate family)